MKETRLRFTTQEKLAILKEVRLNGLEPTLRKYKLTIEMLVRWQKKFKDSKTESVTPIIKKVRKTPKSKKPMHEAPEMNEKEEALLKLVASIIVQIVFDGDMPNR